MPDTYPLDRLFELSPDALVILSWDCRIKQAARSLERLLGYDQQTLLSMPLSALAHPEDVQVVLKMCQHMSKSSTGDHHYEARFLTATNEVRWLAWTGASVPEEQAIYAIARDVTEHKSSHEAMHMQNYQLRDQLNMLELAHDAIIVRDLNNTVMYWNNGAERNYGWAKHEAVGANYQEVLHTDYGRPLAIVESELLNSGYWKGEVTRSARNGSTIVANCQWVLQRDDAGWPISVLEVSRDITKRQQAELAKAQLAAIVEHSADAIMSIGMDARVLTWNQGAEKMFGYRAEFILGLSFFSLVPLGQFSEWQHTLTRIQKGEKASSMDTTLTHIDGSSVPVLVSVSPIRSPRGRPYAMSLIIRDTTRKKLLDKEMARIDRLNLAGQLAAGIGHAVRNPMTTVRGFFQLFSSKPELAAYVDQFTLVISELDRANEIITEFLTLARNRPVSFFTVHLNEMIRSMLPLFVSDAQTDDKQVQLDLADIPPLRLSAKEIRQLIVNLVRNGLEAMTKGGTLTITTQCSENRVVLAVRDEGCGISTEVIDKIGTPFFTTKQDGTGLGLAMCYSVAEQHGANITFETSKQGTTFFVTFPISNQPS